MTQLLYEYNLRGITIRVPVNVYLRYVKYFNLFWEEHTNRFKSMIQLIDNKYFLNKLAAEGCSPQYPVIEFFLFSGCPSIEVKVVEPLLFYE